MVSGCENLTTLPKSFLKLKKLRHFDIRNTPLLMKLPLGIGELKSLQTLTRVIIGGNTGFSITELKGLNDLHGEISIKGLDKVKRSIHAREANLSLKRLTKLELEWSDGSRRGTLEEEVFNELRPHIDTLKMLVVKSYKGIEFPNWVGDPSFHRLVHVSLHGCTNCKSLPSLGRLPSLEILRCEDMSSWEVWSTNSEVMFPCLRELEIRRCPKLIDASLEALPSLRVLKINGCCESVLRSLVRAASSATKLEIGSILGLTDEKWRGVIENLGAVEELSIERCDEIRYLWESNVEASKVFVKLKELKISYCKKIMSLGEKEEDEDNIGSNLLLSLRKLEIESCKSMERLCCPNSIESLVIRWCDSVRQVYFPGATTTGEGGQNLKSLTIMGYEMSMEKINNTSMPMLQDIDICGWKNLKTINQLSNSTHLTSLKIVNCESMESISNLQLSNLTRLRIDGCESIESIPNLQLPNLTHMGIRSCKNMKEIRDLQIPNLISWSIYNCENLESFPYLQLSSLNMLKDLIIRKCPMIDASFPGGIWPPNLVSLEIGGLKKPISEWGNQNFPASLVELVLWGDESHVRNFCQLSELLPSSLTSLDISGFENLESVSTGLQHLTALQHLTIFNCQKMKHLPEMLLLDSLLSLRIRICPKLKERCEGRGSHYWPQISHIPLIFID